MKIVADIDIPFISHYFPDALKLSGRNIGPADIKDAEVLIVRSVTQVNANLLAHSSVKFVGSVTSGMDHIDTAWLDKAGISYYVTQGCNRMAVAEYVSATLAYLNLQGYIDDPANLRIGVIGVGRIGQLVANTWKAQGATIIVNDPVRAGATPEFQSTPLHAMEDLDVISLHVPLTFTGAYPTYHLINAEFLQRQKKGCVLINTSRGAVISFKDLMMHGKHLLWCLDVWENEPHIDLDILTHAILATPHIAGYSLQAKFRSIAMLYARMQKLDIIPSGNIINLALPHRSLDIKMLTSWQEVVLKIFNPAVPSKKMRALLYDLKVNFDSIRKDFKEKYEFAFVKIQMQHLPTLDQKILRNLGLKLTK